MLIVRVLNIQTHSHRPVGQHQTAVLQSRLARGLGCSPLRNDQFYEDLQDLLKLTPKKDVLFIIGDWNAKVGSQETSGVTGVGLGVRNEEGQRRIKFCQENALVIANTLFQQHKRRLYTWTSPDGQYQNQIDYILCSQRWTSSIWSAKLSLGGDCGQDHEHLITKFRLKLRKKGKPLNHSSMT